MDSLAPLIVQLIELASEANLDLARVEAEAVALGRSTTSLLDQLSLEVARKYAKSEISFESADRIMNSVFAMICTEEFIERNGQAFPDITYAVFQAFDEGEYDHSQDAPDENPEEKYTKPMILQVLRIYEKAA